MKTIRRITKNRAFTHLRILVAVLLVLTAAAFVFLAVSPPAVAQPRPRMRLSGGYGDVFQRPSRFLQEIPNDLVEDWQVKRS